VSTSNSEEQCDIARVSNVNTTPIKFILEMKIRNLKIPQKEYLIRAQLRLSEIYVILDTCA